VVTCGGWSLLGWSWWLEVGGGDLSGYGEG